MLAPSGIISNAEATPSAPSQDYGVQLFMFRSAMAKDPRGTIEQLAQIGFREVELANFGASDLSKPDAMYGLSVAEFADLLEQNSMRAPSAHVWGNVPDTETLAGAAARLGVKHIVEPFAFEMMHTGEKGPRLKLPSTLKAWAAICERLNRRGERLADLGLGFAYHNHHIEFAPIEGEEAFAFLVAHTEPKWVGLEVDLGWAAVGGQRPARVLDRYLDRVMGCHLKDYDPTVPLSASAEAVPMPELVQLKTPGAGASDFADIVAVLDQGAIGNRFIEVDISAEPLEDARRGLSHLRALSAA